MADKMIKTIYVLFKPSVILNYNCIIIMFLFLLPVGYQGFLNIALTINVCNSRNDSQDDIAMSVRMKTLILDSIKAATTKFIDNYLLLNADFCFFIIVRMRR